MAMKQCPICGEEYSDTYKKCPFCEEEEAMKAGDAIHRGGRRVVQRSRQFSLITPTLIVLIIIMAGLLVYLLYGDRIADHLDGPDPLPPVEELEPVVPEQEEEAETPEDPPAEGEVTMPEEPDVQEPEKPVTPPVQPEPPVGAEGYQKAAALPAGLDLSITDFTVKIAGEVNTITVKNGSGKYQWYSEDPKVASVDQSGKVTALSSGTVTIIATDGQKKGECIVRVNVPKTSGEVTPEVKPSTSAKLSTEDFTVRVGDPDVKLKVIGGSGTVKWSSADPSIATVSGDGVVKAVSKGTVTVTAAVDGGALKCIVRVK